MKKLIKIVSLLFSIILVVFLVDLYIFRGYFTPDIIYSLNSDNSKNGLATSNNYCDLTINKEDDYFNIAFNNNSYKPFLVWTYRWSTLFPMNDSIFTAHYRLKTNFPKYTNKYEYGLDCGTGAGIFTVNPFESFSYKLTEKNLLKYFYMGAYHQYNIKGDTINDLIHNKPLLIVHNRKNTFKVFERKDLTKYDSIDIQLYLPIFSYNRQSLYYVKSNYFKFSYSKITEQLIQETNQVFKQIYD